MTNKKSNKIITEDLGIIFEKAICLLYNIDYNGNYKYSIEEAEKLSNRIEKIKDCFPFKIEHIAKNKNKYDFKNINKNKTIYLSAKTTKKEGKICPQVIGQPTKKKFIEYFNIDKQFDLKQIKLFIENNSHILLNKYTLHTFNCPIIYYNKHKNLLLFIKSKKNINWKNYEFTYSHKLKNKQWKESSTIMIKNKNQPNNNFVSIGEFQIHNHRDCIKFRWIFEKILKFFGSDFFTITKL